MDHPQATPEPRKRGISLTTQIFIGLAIGVIVGTIEELALAQARVEI